jgi:hypothetical protein
MSGRVGSRGSIHTPFSNGPASYRGAVASWQPSSIRSVKEQPPPPGGRIFEQPLTAEPVRVTAWLDAIGGRSLWRPFKKLGRPPLADRDRRRLERWESAERAAEFAEVGLDELSPEGDRLSYGYFLEWVQYPDEWKLTDYPAHNPDARQDGPAPLTFARGVENLRKSLERARKKRA